MCGIAGGIDKNGVSAELERFVEQAVELQYHRGPDAQVIQKAGETCLLGHNRLSILDLDPRSNQPFSLHSGYFLVFNGEIYNYQELAEKYDLSTQTKSDTEVLYELLRQKGKAAIQELDGMFAFAFVDLNKQQCVLARDRFGIKPIYISIEESNLRFASELRAFTSTKSDINKAGLFEYFSYQTTVSEQTLVKGVEQLQPGVALTVDLQTLDVNRNRYYDTFGARNAESINSSRERDEQLLSIFKEAVEKRLISDVPIGAFLSGGIDSTAIVAAMRAVSNGDIHTFNVSFEDNSELDESSLARETANNLGADHTQIELSESDILSMIPNAVAEMDVPSADAINTYVVSKATKEAGITVALSGLGGDELFAGYPSFHRFNQLQKYPAVGKAGIKIAAILKKIGLKNRSISKLAELDSNSSSEQIVRSSRRLFLDIEIESLLGDGKFLSTLDSPELGILDGPLGISQAELYYYTIPLLLRDTDQMSMQHALEVRVPFFDHQLTEFVRAHAENYMVSGEQLKFGLINALGDLFPKHILDKPKRGFVLPVDQWMRGSLKSFTKDGLFTPENRALFGEHKLQSLYTGFEEGRVLWSQCWSLAVLGHWLHNQKISV